MSLLLHISDTHFGTERPNVVDALLRMAREQAPDVVVLSGDITQRARRSQFKAAREFVDRLAPAAMLAVPGNHDIPLFNLVARMFAPYANHQREFGSDLERVLESADFLVIGVNTTRPSRHKDGEVSSEQIERVSRRLHQARPNQLRIVVTHQPVHVTRPEDERNLLHGGDDAVRAWVNAGVDLLLGGHIHLPYVRPLKERLDDLSRDAWVAQAGTAVSSRLRSEAPNSVNLIRHSGGDKLSRCNVERWDYGRPGDCFELVDRTEIFLDRV
ncbi:MAG TPA: metallophosphoesterase [Burkholderiales bacterium]|nr:metallophosphoesterase [Burkholderiales bacterium]